MRSILGANRRGTLPLGLFVLGVALLASLQPASAQFVQQQVGGISIDANGVVTKVTVDDLNVLKREREQALKPVPNDLKGTALRKISLRELEAAIAQARKNGAPLTDEMRYLAGLQRIQYVFVYPQHNDIVLAGPGEGWKLNSQGEVVGQTTNRPVLLLDDLLVALRSMDAARPTGITCSIDPTTDGLSRLQNLLKRTHSIGDDPQPVMTSIEQTLGPQTVTVAGVPADSHFARVLVAADYRMKRLAMGFDESPIRGLPSFMDMLKTGGGKGARPMLPRWWLAADYDSLLADADGLAWELRGAGVKAMTEDEVLAAGGQRQRTGQANPLAKKWADTMTARYDELSKADAIFGQLRNCMDLAVVAALISKEHLAEKCNWSMQLLLNPELPVESYNAPQHTPSIANATQKGNSWIISASGGVQLNPWQPLEHTSSSAELEAQRSKAVATTSNWWWN